MTRGNKKCIGKVRLYLLSLWLLFLLLLIQTLDIPLYFGKDAIFIGVTELIRRNIVPIILLCLILFDIYTIKEIKVVMKNCPDLPDKISSVKLKNTMTIDFFTSTILPLAFAYFDSIRGYLSLLLILISLGALFVKTNRVYANPTLLILGLSSYDIKFDDDRSITALTFDILEKDNMIAKTYINKGYFYVKRKG